MRCDKARRLRSTTPTRVLPARQLCRTCFLPTTWANAGEKYPPPAFAVSEFSAFELSGLMMVTGPHTMSSSLLYVSPAVQTRRRENRPLLSLFLEALLPPGGHAGKRRCADGTPSQGRAGALSLGRWVRAPRLTCHCPGRRGHLDVPRRSGEGLCGEG